MIDLHITYLHWMILGIVLMGSEILTGTAFALWIGVASCSVGSLNWIFPFNFSTACVLFAVLTCVWLWLGKKIIKKICHSVSDDASVSMLNNKSNAMIGRTLTLSAPISQGIGKTIVGDSVWTVHGLDLPEGSAVTVTAIEGNALVVKPKLP